MSTPIATERSLVPADAAPTSARIDLARALHDDLTSYSGPAIIFGIGLAGGAYPIVLGSGYLFAAILFVVWAVLAGYPLGFAASDFGAVFLYVAVGSVIFTFVGFVWAALASALTMPIVYLFLKSLQIRGSFVMMGAACGGLAGFVAVLPVVVSLPWITGLGDAGIMALILAFGPGLTTILGQIGGAWGARRAAYFGSLDNAKAMAAESPELLSAMGWVVAEESSDSTGDEPQLQFSIRHVLWIFVWISLLLSVIKLCRLPFEFVLPLLVGWFFYQLVTLRVGSFLASRLVPWWRNRRRRST